MIPGYWRKSNTLGMAMALFIVAITPALWAQDSKRALFNGKDLDGWQHVGPGSFG